MHFGKGILYVRPAGLRLLTVLVLTGFAAAGSAQALEARSQSAEVAATLARVTLLRDSFVQKIHSDGFTCPIAPPAIVVEDVPSYGQYNDATNTLRTSEWTLMQPGEKAFFLRFAGPGADDAAGRAIFEKASHGWIFVHELGHWWQACQGFSAHHTHYQVEYGANRMALAYWRQVDPGLATLMMTLFHQILEHRASPVPPGERVEAYFDKHYETLGPSPAYPWFQSRMCLAAEQEAPEPSFKAVLEEASKR